MSKKLPQKYLKAEDPCVDTLQNLNKQRQAEIQSTQTAVDGLERRVRESEKELERAEKIRDQWMEKLNSVHEMENKHDDLVQSLAPQKKTSTQSAPILELSSYKRAPKGTMAEFVRALSG